MTSLKTAVDPKDRFGFGRNWNQYIKTNFSQERVNLARKKLLDFLELDSLEGMDFLDIGCGSGLHSLAAHQSRARSIFSFDYDPNSVATTRRLHGFAGSPASWRIARGSVLDAQFMQTIPRANLVYSWGVLHHTGDVWTAINNAADRVADGGQFFIALYSADVATPEGMKFWLAIKHKYNRLPWIGRAYLDWWYVWRFMLNKDLRRIPEFLERRRMHKLGRGMDLMTDVRDWLGGWPMEYTYDAEVIEFAKARGLILKKIKTGEANTEFLFRRESRPA